MAAQLLMLLIVNYLKGNKIIIRSNFRRNYSILSLYLLELLTKYSNENF
jgi:hypothetical protein